MHPAVTATSQGWVRRSLDLIAHARLALKEARDRRLLKGLDDHMLSDIGLCRMDLGCDPVCGAFDRDVERFWPSSR
jgi:uncharacterized protein YjiS (DUF1127 family)